jgi:hypothetical protein
MTSFVEGCLREYHRRLPPGPRTGPARSGRFANAGQLAQRVPLDMYDGGPDGLDLVLWKPVPSTLTDKALGEFLGYFNESLADPIGVVPAVLKEYIRACHMFRVELTLGDDVLTLPAIPTSIRYHDDDSLNPFARFIYRWSVLLPAGYYPFGELGPRGGDSDRIVAFDLSSGGVGDDAPVVSFGRDDLHRLRLHARLAGESPGHDRVAALASPRFPGLREALSAFCLSPEANRLDPSEPSPYATPTSSARDDFLLGADAVADDFARLQAKLSYLRRCDPASTLNLSGHHQYRPNPRLTEADIRAFEIRHRCRLPAAYRDFLAVIGDGGPGPGFNLSSLADVDADLSEDGDGYLERPFPHHDLWNPTPGDGEDRYEFMADYDGPRPVAGSIVLNYEGCGLSDRLVVTGDSAGEVWIDNRASDYGLKPGGCRGPRSFLAWYEGWLDRSIRQAPLAG